MTKLADIIFYAPMKPPDHPVPSGDRTMARLLMKALAKAGFRPEIVTRFRSYEKDGATKEQEAIHREAEAEAQRIVADLRRRPALPRLWFSYHVYYKSPDWIGPRVARELGIPYVAAEGSRAMKRAGGPWAIGHEGAEKALDAADVIFAMTARDEEALRIHAPAGQNIVSLPPFIDLDEWPYQGPIVCPDGKIHCITVAMMRAGDKLESYRQLAAALSHLSPGWRLDIVGDGPARPEVKALFPPFGDTIYWHGAITDRDALTSIYASGHLFVWPAVNEAYGMTLLEAQACGCAVLAGNHGGVASVVRDGETGLLVPPNDVEAFSSAIDALKTDRARLHALRENARRLIREERSLDSAACILANTLQPLVERRAP